MLRVKSQVFVQMVIMFIIQLVYLVLGCGFIKTKSNSRKNSIFVGFICPRRCDSLDVEKKNSFLFALVEYK